MKTKSLQFMPDAKARQKAAESQREMFHPATTSVAANAVKAAKNDFVKRSWVKL